MKYKASMFNVITQIGNTLYLFNSATKMYLKTNDLIEETIKVLNELDVYIDTLLFKTLYSKGFIVEAEKDEMRIAELRKNDYIYSSALDVCILPTEQCNLRCVYCYENYKLGEMTESTQQAFVLWLKKNIRRYTSVRVEWFGGEPLVAKNVIYKLSEQIINICREARKPYTASITTNGTLLDLDTFKMLLRCHVTSFQVTVDGPKETHDKLRVRSDKTGTFDWIMNNLQAIKEECKTSARFKIAIRANITQEVSKLIGKYLNDMEGLFGKDKRFTFYFRPVGKWGNLNTLPIDKSLLHEFDSLYQPILATKAKLDYSMYCVLLEDSVCMAAKRNQFVLRPNGEVCKCTMLLDHEENRIGKLEQDGRIILDDQKLAKWLIPDNWLPAGCKQCPIFCSCFGRTCPAKGYILNASDPPCGYEAKSMQYIIQLLDSSGVFKQI